MNQRDAVFQAVKNVVGEIQGKVELSKAQKEKVHTTLITQFLEGEIEFRGQAVTPDIIKKYVPGLVNNWLRKDARLNGDTKYVPKNPGSRMGSGDESLKAMKALLAATSDPEARTAIQAEIEKRKAELKPRPSINLEALPEHLRHLVPSN